MKIFLFSICSFLIGICSVCVYVIYKAPNSTSYDLKFIEVINICVTIMIGCVFSYFFNRQISIKAGTTSVHIGNIEKTRSLLDKLLSSWETYQGASNQNQNEIVRSIKSLRMQVNSIIESSTSRDKLFNDYRKIHERLSILNGKMTRNTQINVQSVTEINSLFTSIYAQLISMQFAIFK